MRGHHPQSPGRAAGAGERDPGVADPGVADPGVADPGVADPGVADPGVADPGVFDPGVSDPGVSDPLRAAGDWRKQLDAAASLPGRLKSRPAWSADRMNVFDRVCSRFPAKVTPCYASLMRLDDPLDPIAAMVLPDPRELDPDNALMEDPLAEEAHMAAPGLIHRYPDRALLLSTDVCAVHCRFCTRKRRVGRMSGPLSDEEVNEALSYLHAHPQIREVIVSGGDPLTMEDERLDHLLTRLGSVPSVEVLRLGTRIPAVLPSRVTPALSAMLARHNPLYVLTHFNHARELTPEAVIALRTLSDHGVPLANQTVLLAGVNDQVEIIEALCRTLLSARVRPYYLHQCDLTLGTGHFRTPLSTGLEIMQALRARLSGLAVPTFAVDLPHGRGKVPLEPQHLAIHSSGRTMIRDGGGQFVDYPDVGSTFAFADPP